MTRRVSHFLVLAMLLPTNARGAATYFWSVSGSGSWTTAANWTPARTTPATDDILVFDGGSLSPPTTTATDVPNQTIGQLLVIGGARVTLTPLSAVAVTINGDSGDDLFVGTNSILTLHAVSGTGDRIQLILPTGTTGSIGGELSVAGGLIA